SGLEGGLSMRYGLRSAITLSYKPGTAIFCGIGFGMQATGGECRIRFGTVQELARSRLGAQSR
ncbi:MAG TPA: hypothetical protein DCG04_16125, partial [Rhodospirillaceae bacterium]|nr:hypothetical protein [Rhodospirillaceae bacterium]